MTLAIVDTSIFCELLQVPHMCAEHNTHLAEFKQRIDAKEWFLLPMVTIFETGNHIGQNGNGQQRRQAAERFVERVTQAVSGKSPFTTTPFVDAKALAEWLREFPRWASHRDTKGKGSGLGDLSIKKEWERQCDLHPSQRVYIWSNDKHLSGYDRDP